MAKPAPALLRLHADDAGVVWAADADSAPVRTGVQARRFAADGLKALGFPLHRVTAVRLFGRRENAPLVVDLWNARRTAAGTAVRVLMVGPAACPPRISADPAAALAALAQPPGGLGLAGSYRLRDVDYSAYSLADQVDACGVGGRLGETCHRVFAYHPAHSAFSFIPTLDRDAACRLAADVIDPRWFRHPHRSDRLSRLFSYLGLTPDNAAAFLGSDTAGRHFGRARTAFGVWCRLGKRADYDDPANFLYRVFRDRGGGPRGLLVATRRMLSFVVAVWENRRQGGQQDWVFRPQQFFASAAEVKAYEAHSARSGAV